MVQCVIEDNVFYRFIHHFGHRNLHLFQHGQWFHIHHKIHLSYDFCAALSYPWNLLHHRPYFQQSCRSDLCNYLSNPSPFILFLRSILFILGVHLHNFLNTLHYLILVGDPTYQRVQTLDAEQDPCCDVCLYTCTRHGFCHGCTGLLWKWKWHWSCWLCRYYHCGPDNIHCCLTVNSHVLHETLRYEHIINKKYHIAWFQLRGASWLPTLQET